MAQPTYTAGAVAALLAPTTLAASKSIATFLDFSTNIEGQVSARVSTGGTSQANSFTKNEGYFCYGQTTLSAQATAGATTCTVTSATGFAIGQVIVIGNEKHTVSNVSGTTLTIDAIVNTQANGTSVYLIESTPTYAGVNSMGGTASTTYAKTTFISTGKWIFLLTNGDSANSVTVELTLDTVVGFA